MPHRPFIACSLAAALFAAGCAGTRAIEPQIAAADIAWGEAAEAEVVLSSFNFAPDPVRLAAGVPVRLTIRSASGGHDFTAPDFFAAARVAPGDAGLIAGGQIDLAGGESVTLRLIPAAGSYDLVCTHTGHALLGMRGEIVVE